MAEWYYFQGGNQQGPVSDEQLRGMVASGQLNPGDSVWKQGMANWAPISSVPDLMPASAPAPTAPPAGGYGGAPQGGYGGGAPQGGYGAPQGGPAPADYDAPYSDARPRAFGSGLISIWSIILVAGAGLWFINFFLPWKAGFGGTALGLHFGLGIFAFIIALMILGGVITSWFLPVLAEWRWTGAFFFALMAFILLILGFFVFAGGFNSIGPFLHLFATLAVLAGAVLEGVFGLLAFLAKNKAAQQQQPQQPQQQRGPGPSY